MTAIERGYSRLKAFLRKIAARTVAGLPIAIGGCAHVLNPPSVPITSKPARMIQVDRSLL
jgi:hypothetical protein